ncbi:MAG: branched-chain amino acid ABC transporter permease [Bacillota bacterium]
MNKRMKNFWLITAAVSVSLIVIAGLIYLDVIDDYTAQILTFAAINVIIALSLNLISGFTGQLCLGHAGFMAIGAYSTAVLVMQAHYPMLAAILIGGFITTAFGLVIGFPTLRLKGDYLAIVTLGFGEIIRVLMVNADKITGGAAGLKGIPPFTNNNELSPMVSFIWVFLFMTGTIILISNLIKSSHGRAIISIREDEVAANAMGVNVFYYKMFSFTLSAFIAGIGGGLYALFFGYLNPTMFNFMTSTNFLVIVVLGGMGSIIGTVATGFILTYLQEFLRFLQDYRLVIYPLILIVIMIFKPSGLVGIVEDLKNWVQKNFSAKRSFLKAGERQ